MKVILFAAGLLMCFNSFSQAEQTCYQKYAKVFEVRGANQVEDGWHEDIIVTIRKGSFADCFLGKVKVVNGQIDKSTIALSFIDETFESLTRSYKYDEPVTILNGISKTLVTNDEELINLMFVSSVKPKKKALKRAPEPEFDL
jgi:hypothetical protein